MAKPKTELFKDAQTAGLVASDASADDYTGEDLQALLSGNTPAWKGSQSSDKPIIASDGHVTLSQEDIDSRA